MKNAMMVTEMVMRGLWVEDSRVVKIVLDSQKSYPARTKPPANGGQRRSREAHGVCWDTLRMPERALGPNFLGSISTSKTTGLPEIGFPIVVYPKRCNSIGFARDEESTNYRILVESPREDFPMAR